jgi:hypothetical protein
VHCHILNPAPRPGVAHDNEFLSDVTCPGGRVGAQEEPGFQYGEEGMAFARAKKAGGPRRPPGPWPDLPFCSAGNWEVVVAGGEDTGHSIGFRCSSVTNISVGKGRWAVYVVLCA